MDYDELEADRQVSINITDRLARVRGEELGIKLPEHHRVILIINVAYGMMLVDTAESIHLYLCSPAGYVKVPTWCHTVWEAAKEIGLKISHRKDKRTWENIEPYWVAVALSKL